MQTKLDFSHQSNSVLKRKWSLPVILVSVVILLNSGFALTTGYNKETAILSALFMVVLFFKIPKGLLSHFGSLNRDQILLLLMLLSIFFAILVNLDFASFFEYARICIIIASAYILSNLISAEDFFYYFTRIMRLVTMISLIFFSLIKYASLTLPIINNGYGVSYYSIYIFSTNHSLAGMDYLRNSSVFWEPGLFAGFIMLALIAEIVFLPKSKYRFLVFIMYGTALLSTQSAAAYAYMALAVLLILSYKSDNTWALILMILIGIATAYFIIEYDKIVVDLMAWNPKVFSKLLQENASFTDRLSNPIADMLICLSHPLGIGIGSLTNAAEDYAIGISGEVLTSRTSTLTYYFAAFGIIGGFVFNYSWISGVLKIPRIRFLAKALVIIAIISLSSASPMYSNMTFWIVIFMLTRGLFKEQTTETTIIK